MEDSGDAQRATSLNAVEDRTDATLTLLLGRSLQAATLRLALYVIVLSSVVATIATLV